MTRLVDCPELDAWVADNMRLPAGYRARWELARDRALVAGRPTFTGRGIVTVASGDLYRRLAARLVAALRSTGCTLPVLVYGLPEDSLRSDVPVIVADPPCRRQRAQALKSTAINASPFAEVLFLDADTVPLRDVTPLFDAPAYRDAGAVLWVAHDRQPPEHAEALGLPVVDAAMVEGGHVLVDKRRCWAALLLSRWMNDRSDESYRLFSADNPCLQVAFQATASRYVEPGLPEMQPWGLLQPGLDGRPMFEHRCWSKGEVAD